MRNLSWIFFPLLTKTSTSYLSTSRSPWGGTCRGSSCHSQRTPGVRPPSRCPPSPPWSSYTDRPAVLFDHILISVWSYTDTDPLLVFLTDHYCNASPSSSGLYTTIIRIESPFLLQKLFSLFNLDHKSVRLRHLWSRRSWPDHLEPFFVYLSLFGGFLCFKRSVSGKPLFFAVFLYMNSNWSEICFRCQLEKLYSCRFKNRRCYCWRLRRLRAWAGPSRHWENGSHRRAPSTFSSQPPPPPSTRPNPFPSDGFRCLKVTVNYWTFYDIPTCICIVFHCTVVSTTVCQFCTYFDIQTYLCPSFGNILISKLAFALFWLSGGLFVFCCLFCHCYPGHPVSFFTFCIQWIDLRLFVI